MVVVFDFLFFAEVFNLFFCFRLGVFLLVFLLVLSVLFSFDFGFLSDTTSLSDLDCAIFNNFFDLSWSN